MKRLTHQVSAFILHARPYQESSLILQVFSRESGRFSLIAKGVKGKRSQARKAVLQPFQELRLEYTGKSELKTLLHCERFEPYAANAFLLQEKKLACAYYASELLIRGLPEGCEYSELYVQYANLLSELSHKDQYADYLRQFEVSLLRAIGLAPDFKFDIEQQPIDENWYYLWVPEQGFSRAAEKEMSRGFSGHAILALGEKNTGQLSGRECQHICRLLLQEVIGNKPLQSRKMWHHINLIQTGESNNEQ